MPIKVTIFVQPELENLKSIVNRAPFLESPPADVEYTIDRTEPTLDFFFVLSNAFDDQNALDYLLISSRRLGSVKLTYPSETNVPVLDSQDSEILLYDSSTTKLTVHFASSEQLQVNIGRHDIKVTVSDVAGLKTQYDILLTIEPSS